MIVKAGLIWLATSVAVAQDASEEAPPEPAPAQEADETKERPAEEEAPPADEPAPAEAAEAAESAEPAEPAETHEAPPEDAEPIERPDDPAPIERPDPEPAEPAPEPEVDAWGGDEWGSVDGFSSGAEDAEEATGKSSPFTLSGFLQTQDALWVERLSTEPVGLARQSGELSLRYSQGDLRAVGTLHAEIDPYYLLGDFEPSVQRAYGWQVRPGELWLGGSAGPVDIFAGRQVVALGEGVLLTPLDVVAPRDLRDPGMTEVADLRLPVTMLRVGVFVDKFRLEAIGIPEADFGFRSPPEGPFGLLPGLAARAETPETLDVNELLDQIETAYVHTPSRFSLAGMQAMGRLMYRGRGFDLGLYGGSVLDKQGALANPEGLDIEFETTDYEITLEHLRYTLLGHSGAVVAGDLVARWEFVASLGKAHNIGEVLSVAGTSFNFNPIVDERTMYTGMLGFGYTGIKHTRIDLEASKSFLDTVNLTFPTEAMQYALRVSHLSYKERLEIAGLFMGVGATLEYGWAANLIADYELADGLHAGLGYVTYFPGDELGPLLGYDTHDRLFTTVRWDF